MVMTRSRYPRPGQKLAPKALRELLRMPVPKKYLSSLTTEKPTTKKQLLRLCDLDESAWEMFPEETCRKLSKLIVLAAGQSMRTHSVIGFRKMPALPEGVDLTAEAGSSLEEITRASRESGERISRILTAVREQARAASHVVELMERVRD